MKRIQVNLTLSWTFDEKEWSDEKAHRERLKENPRVILGDDILHSMYCLNDITYPDLKDIKIEEC